MGKEAGDQYNTSSEIDGIEERYSLFTKSGEEAERVPKRRIVPSTLESTGEPLS